MGTYASFVCGNCGACAVAMEVGMKISFVCNQCGADVSIDIANGSRWYDAVACANCGNNTHLCVWREDEEKLGKSNE